MNCTVISTYFGHRRTAPSGLCDSIKYMNDLLNFLIKLDSGVESDIIVVNHEQPENTKKQALDNIEAKEFLSEFDGVKTVNGKIKVLNRPRSSGMGASFKSFDYAFKNFKDQYDYWFFIEDDVGISLSKYFLYSINQLQEENVAFICACTNGFGTSVGRHCYGGAGCTHKKFLDEIVDKNGHLPYCNEDKHNLIDYSSQGYASSYRCQELEGEVAFTNILLKYGYEISLFNTEKYSNGDKIVIGDCPDIGQSLLGRHLSVNVDGKIIEGRITQTDVIDSVPVVKIGSEYHSMQNIIFP